MTPLERKQLRQHWAEIRKQNRRWPNLIAVEPIGAQS
jgi:hypothetical protein